MCKNCRFWSFEKQYLPHDHFCSNFYSEKSGQITKGSDDCTHCNNGPNFKEIIEFIETVDRKDIDHSGISKREG